MYPFKIYQIVLCLILFSSVQLFADEAIVIESESTSGSGAKTTTKIYISNDNLLIKNVGKDNSTFLYNSSKEIFTFIDNNKKEYYEFDQATLSKLKEQLSMFLMMMKQFSSQMPPEQKKKLEPFLNPDSQPKIQYTKTGNEKIGAWETEKYSGTADNEEVLNINIASYDAIGFPRSSFLVLESMTNFAIQNLKELLPLLPYEGSTSMMGLDENSPVIKDGLPIKTSSYKNEELTNQNIVTAINKVSISTSQFNIPSGYQKKTINLQKQFAK